MDGGEEGLAVFSVSCCDTAPSFEHQESIFNQVAQLVEFFVIGPLYDAIFLGRDNGFHTLNNSLLDNRICIITFVGDEVIGAQAIDQF